MKKLAIIFCAAMVIVLLSVPTAQARNFALIVSAGEATTDDAAVNSCFWYNVVLIYKSLLALDFDHEDIYVCYGSGSNFNSSYSCYQVLYTIPDYNASREMIQSACSALAAETTSGDFLYIWWMGHGSPVGSNLSMYIETTGEEVYDYEIAGWLAPIACQTRAASWMTCYSGGILDDLENTSSIVMSSATFYESTYDAVQCDTYHAEFHYPEQCAWEWETPCGICGPVDADTDGSGRVSFLEAFNYADANTVDSDPQFSDLGSLAATTYLGTPLLAIGFPNGLESLVPPGEAIDIAVRITEGEESLIPGTATFSYRLQSGSFTTTALVPMGGDLYQATIPAPSCDDTPEFYFTAEGTVSGVINQPANAPTEIYDIDVGQYVVFFEETMDSDPGWVTQDLWAFGQPTGGGGQYGGPDPTSGHTGSNVYGYNLSGDYQNSLSERHLTTGPIDCSGRSNVKLSFWRWLGVETSSYDHAYVRVSPNGLSWTTVWENTGSVEDDSWNLMEYDISSIADDQGTVYLRWTQGITDSSWQYCGWNIDDLRLESFECDDGANPDTVSTGLSCQPSSGVLPFSSQFTATLGNLTSASRRAAARIDVVTANGSSYANWRSGFTNLDAGEVHTTVWSQNLPAVGSLVGSNVFTITAEDVTPPPYNQPPYSAAGDTDTDSCTVTASAK